MERITASARTRKSIEQMIAKGELDCSELIRQSLRLIVEEALGGRAYNQHRASEIFADL